MGNSEEICKDLEKVLAEAKRMGCKEVKVFHNIPVKNIEVIVKSLEKQIAKKPDYEGDGYADGELVYDTWICPYCEKHYEVDYDDYKFCPECGQKIEWSAEN